MTTTTEITHALEQIDELLDDMRLNQVLAVLTLVRSGENNQQLAEVLGLIATLSAEDQAILCRLILHRLN